MKSWHWAASAALSYFLGLTGVWLSLSVSETGVMLLAIAMLYKANKKSA